MKENLELLNESILEEQGAFKKVRRFYKDWHPNLLNAVLINDGWQGKETKQEITIIKPSRVIKII